MPINIPTYLLRSFMAIVDTNSMVRAAEEVHLTQSALSLQMRRLQELLQIDFFSRSGRNLRLTPAGRELYEHAERILNLNDKAVALLAQAGEKQRIRIGCVQDFAETVLEDVFANLFRENADLLVEVKVSISTELVEMLQRNQIDLVIRMSPQAQEADEIMASAPVKWYGKSELFDLPVLPIALLTKPCGIRDAIVDELERSAKPYRLIVETRSISALRAAVRSGMAVTGRAGMFMPPEHVYLGDSAPPLPMTYILLTCNPGLPPQIEPMIDLVRNSIVRFADSNYRVTAGA